MTAITKVRVQADDRRIRVWLNDVQLEQCLVGLSFQRTVDDRERGNRVTLVLEVTELEYEGPVTATLRALDISIDRVAHRAEDV